MGTSPNFSPSPLLALSVVSFPIVCLFPLLVPCSLFTVLASQFFAVIIRPRLETANFYVYRGFEHMIAIFFSKLLHNSLEFSPYEYWPTLDNLMEVIIRAIKFEIACVRFLSDVFVTVAAVAAEAPGALLIKAPGLTLIIHNFETNKQNFTIPDIFLKFNRINSLLY